MKWGKRKSDNQSYPKTRKPKLSKTGSTRAVSGIKFTKLAKGKPNVKVFGGDIYIYDKHGNEIVSWVSSEWKEDPSIIPSIKNAIKLSNNPEKLKRVIGGDLTNKELDAEHYKSMRILNKQSPRKCSKCHHGNLCHDGHICLFEGCDCEENLK